jgi:hypothetical protein
VINVLPSGRGESGLLGWSFYSGLVVVPGQSGLIQIVASPNEPGNHRFSFIPNRLDTQQLVGDDGKQIVIGGEVAVSR